ncbi:MAG: YtoQ family protein [Marinicaulis sp.]|nr:YtoQ family protein [Marinicaulis sp.]NNE41764.1 YtoQ family protein [Marinicaulis sp.]NNL89983.1 YtoQ family protein [Marinicaulis sp.]
MRWRVYLSGEIHTDWRDQIVTGAVGNDLDIEFTSANIHHESSDAAGDVLGRPDDDFWRDHQSAKINSIRTRTLIKNCDIAVIRFGEKYKQWNAAFDAGQCAALQKPYITLHDASIVHALKEVDAAAVGWAKSPDQVVEILKYTLRK